MCEPPLISALLPVWTGTEYLDESVNSILSQTITDWELLIIGEPDGDTEIKKIAFRYAQVDNRIHWIENETHLGLAASLNKGIQLAKGKYIARVDVDDPSYPERFEKQAQYLDEHPEIGVLGTQFREVYPNRCGISDYPTKPENIKTCLLFRVCISHPTVMFPRKLFLVNNWEYPNEIVEDYSLWINILDSIPFANLDEPLLDRRFSFETNITFLKGRQVLDFNQTIRQQAIQKYFHIDTHSFALNRFLYFADLPCERVPITELVDWIADSVYLLLEMEKANRQYPIFDNKALARTLRKRWNWILDGSLISKIFCISPNLPRLTEKTDGLFSGDLCNALQSCRTIIQQSSFESFTDDIISIIRHFGTNFVGHLTDLFKFSHTVIIFGVGQCCDQFLTNFSDTDPYFHLRAFCDNDPAKQGQTKHGFPIFGPKELLNMEFDYVLIATRDYHDEIHSQLTEMGLQTDRILPLDIFRYKARL